MEFKTPGQEDIYYRILPWMHELFGESLVVFDDEPLLIVNLGSAVASTRVVPWHEGQTLITTRSYVVTNVEITAELSYYLLRENNSIYFGRFAYDAEDDIVFEHSLVGTACDRIALNHSVTTVIRIADTYDDEIVARWGGKRALDRWASA